MTRTTSPLCVSDEEYCTPSWALLLSPQTCWLWGEKKTETHTLETQRTDGAVELQTALLMMRRPLWSSSIHFRNSVKHSDQQVLQGPLCEAQKDLIETSYGTAESSCFWTTVQTLFIWKFYQGKLMSRLLSRLSCTSFDVRITDKSGRIHRVGYCCWYCQNVVVQYCCRIKSGPALCKYRWTALTVYSTFFKWKYKWWKHRCFFFFF